MSTITKLEVNLSERYIPPVEPEEGSEEWCQDHLEDPRCEQYRPVDPDDPVDPTPEEPEEGSEEWCEIHTDSELCKEQEEDNEETGDTPDTGHHTIVSVGDNNNTPTSTPFIVAGAAIALLVLVACFVKFFKHKKEDKNHYYFKQQKGYKKAYATILPVLSLALIAGIFARVFAYNYDVYPDLAASENLTIDNADIIGTDEIRYVKDTLVLPKSNYGYELYIHADDNKLVSDYNQGIYLDPVASTGALTENTFGYTFVNPATNPNTFERLSQTAERIITKAYSPEQTKDGISLDIWWGVNAKSAEEANYELEITYDLHEQQIITELQDMTPEICADMPTDHFESFIDIRNNKTYQVYKDDFGRCNVEGILTHDEGGNPTIEPISRDQFPDLDPEESICPTGWHEVEIPATETAAATTGCVADYENIEVTIFDIDEDGNIVFNGSETIDLDDERCEGWTCTFIAPDQPEGAEPGQEFYGWSTDLDAETGEYQPGEEITIDSPNFALYPIWEKKTPKALLTDNNVVNFVYDYYQKSEIESDKDGYKTNYEKNQDNNVLLAIYEVPKNSTANNSFLPTSYDQDYVTRIRTIKFDETFKEFTPTSTRSWFKELVRAEEMINPENLNMSKVQDASGMFSNYRNQSSGGKTELKLSAWDMSSVKNLTNIFYETGAYAGATIIEAENWQLTSLEYPLDSAFCQVGRHSGTNVDIKVDISGWNIGKATSAKNMFYYNTNGSSFYGTKIDKIDIDVSGWIAEYLQDTSRMFYNLGYDSRSSVDEITINISDWNAKHITNQEEMFASIEATQEVKIDFGDVEEGNNSWFIPANASVKDMFYGTAANSYSLDTKYILNGIENWNVNEATNLDNLFDFAYIPYDGAEVLGLDLSKWDVKNVKSAQKTFYNLGFSPSLRYNAERDYSTEINVNWGEKTRNFENISGMFQSTKSDKSIDGYLLSCQLKGIESWNVSNITDMSETFNSASFAHKDDEGKIIDILDLSTWDVSSLKDASSMFNSFGYWDDTGATTINIPWGEKTKNIEDMSRMFEYINGQEINIDGLENINTSSVKNMREMFYESYGNADLELNLSSWDVSNVTNMSSMFEYAGNKKVNLDLHGWNVKNVGAISAIFRGLGTSSFQDKNTEEVVLNVSNWQGIGESTSSLSNLCNMLGYYSNHVEINLTGWDTSKIVYMDRMFGGAGSNSDQWPIIGVEDFDVSSVINAEYMFSNVANSGSIKELDLSSWQFDSTKIKDIQGMFNGVGVKKLNLSGWFEGQTIDELAIGGLFSDIKAEEINLSKWGILTNPKQYYMSYSQELREAGIFDQAPNLSRIYASSGWTLSRPSDSAYDNMFENSVNLAGYDSAKIGAAYAHVYNGTDGYFTDVCEKDNSCGEVQGQQGQQTEQPPLMSYSPSPNYSYTPISEQSTEESTDESETEKPVSTGEEKKSTKKSDTKSEQTEPLGVEKSVEKASTVDTATIAVIVASFVLVSAGAVIIFLIEKRRNEDEE